MDRMVKEEIESMVQKLLRDPAALPLNRRVERRHFGGKSEGR
jgi:hypothetical protein